jgi:hypothetical protein
LSFKKDREPAMSTRERRQAPRVEVNLPITVEGGTAEVSGKTLNISTMSLVIQDGALDKGKGGEVQFDGIVVRVEPEERRPDVVSYRVAVFFTRVPEKSMAILKDFVEKSLQ